jgi:hypothetical protein
MYVHVLVNLVVGAHVVHDESNAAFIVSLLIVSFSVNV